MWSSEEARKTAENSINDKTREELAVTEKCIKEAVEGGKMECWCYKYLGTQAVRKLKDKGYAVENRSDQRDGIMFLIKW